MEEERTYETEITEVPLQYNAERNNMPYRDTPHIDEASGLICHEGVNVTVENKESDEFDRIHYGYYSQQASDRGYKMFRKSTPDGKLIWVTYVTEDPEARDYRWPDKHFVGKCYLENK